MKWCDANGEEIGILRQYQEINIYKWRNKGFKERSKNRINKRNYRLFEMMMMMMMMIGIRHNFKEESHIWWDLWGKFRGNRKQHINQYPSQILT